MTHDVYLVYTTADDGVHIRCTCGWEANLGFDCRPATAAHLADCHLAGSYRQKNGVEDLAHLVTKLQVLK